jgi:D-alanine-D-alanine ligase
MSPSLPKVGIFLGGPSSEHEVSLLTGGLMLARLDRGKFDPAPIFVDRERAWHFPNLPYEGPDFLAACAAGISYRPHSGQRLPWRPDVALLGLHGAYGEDGEIQRELSALEIPYTGSGPAASQLAMNKQAAKGAFHRAGLPVPEELPIRAGESAEEAATRIARFHPGPWVIKPRDGGSSIGVTIASSPEGLAEGLAAAVKHGPMMVEPFLPGRELTCGVLEEPGTHAIHALPPTEIIPKGGGFFDYTAKYKPGGSQEITPAHLTHDETCRVQELALAAHELLGCSGYSRSDFILSPRDGIILLETNTLPGMTETSLLPQAAAAIGISYTDLLTRFLSLAKH